MFRIEGGSDLGSYIDDAVESYRHAARSFSETKTLTRKNENAFNHNVFGKKGIMSCEICRNVSACVNRRCSQDLKMLPL